MTVEELSDADTIRVLAPSLGLRIDNQDYLVDIETGDRIEAQSGEPIPVTEIADLRVRGEENNHQVVLTETSTQSRTPAVAD